MKKLHLTGLFFLWCLFSAQMSFSDVIIQDMKIKGGGFNSLRPKGNSDNNLVVVLAADAEDTGYTKSLWCDKNGQEYEVTIIEDTLRRRAKSLRSPEYPRVMGVKPNGLDSVGYWKATTGDNAGHGFYYNPTDGMTNFPPPSGYGAIRPMKISNSNTVVGYVLFPTGNGPRRQAFYKDSLVADPVLFQYGGENTTEFISVNESSIAIGQTGSGLIFSYNINTGETEIMFGGARKRLRRESNNFRSQAPTPISFGDDNELLENNSYDEVGYTMYDPQSDSYKGVIASAKNLGGYTLLEVDGATNTWVSGINNTGGYVGIYSSKGESKAFIATDTTVALFEDEPYYFYGRYYAPYSSGDVYWGIDVKSEQLFYDFKTGVFPVKMTVEIAGASKTASNILRLTWDGDLSIYCYYDGYCVFDTN